MLGFWITAAAMLAIAAAVLWPFSIWFGDLLTRKPPDLRQWFGGIFSTKPAYQPASPRVTMRLGLAVAANKASLEWLEKTRHKYWEIDRTMTASDLIALLRSEEATKPREYPIAGQLIVSRSQLLFALQGAQQLRQAPNFTGKASLHDTHASLTFQNAASISVVATNAVRQTATIGELTWPN